ncbi:hypothetical protein BDR07DRAFT_1444169 [Suillus spraguei]|nr:hypothetical protein BDR07DRAFT_1444169 [Suillus spraguei]
MHFWIAAYFLILLVGRIRKRAASVVSQLPALHGRVKHLEILPWMSCGLSSLDALVLRPGGRRVNENSQVVSHLSLLVLFLCIT